MEEIGRISAMLDRFRNSGVRSDSKQVADFQDVIMRHTEHEISDLYGKFDREYRRLFVWACSCCFDFEQFIGILKATVILQERQRLYEDFNADMSAQTEALEQDRAKLRDEREQHAAEVGRLEQEINHLIHARGEETASFKRQIKALEDANACLTIQLSNYKQDLEAADRAVAEANQIRDSVRVLKRLILSAVPE